MAKVGELQGELTLNSTQFDSAIGKAKGSLGSIGTAALAFGAIVAGAFISVSKNGLQVASDLETARQGFITLLGSASKADDIIKTIKKDASSTPFEINGLIKANQLLTSVTKDGNKSERMLMNVGRALAAMGKGQPELDRIIINLQQIGAVGKASMLDIKQFAFAGIPIFDMLQSSLKKTGAEINTMITNGEISYGVLEKMFQKAGEGSGQFAKAFENQSGTLAQLFSNLKDNWNVFTADFVTNSGIFEIAKVAVGNMTSAFGFMSAKLKEANDPTTTLGKSLLSVKVSMIGTDGKGGLFAAVNKLFASFDNDKAMTSLNKALDTISKLIDGTTWLINNLEKIQSTMKTIDKFNPVSWLIGGAKNAITKSVGDTSKVVGKLSNSSNSTNQSITINQNINKGVDIDALNSGMAFRLGSIGNFNFGSIK